MISRLDSSKERDAARRCILGGVEDHYAVEFTGLVLQPARTLTVMMPIVLDLTLYGPD
jgi:hypothetical protein